MTDGHPVVRLPTWDGSHAVGKGAFSDAGRRPPGQAAGREHLSGSALDHDLGSRMNVAVTTAALARAPRRGDAAVAGGRVDQGEGSRGREPGGSTHAGYSAGAAEDRQRDGQHSQCNQCRRTDQHRDEGTTEAPLRQRRRWGQLVAANFPRLAVSHHPLVAVPHWRRPGRRRMARVLRQLSHLRSALPQVRSQLRTVARHRPHGDTANLTNVSKKT